MLTNGATSALPPSLERAEEAADNTCCCNEIESGAAQREGERRTGGGRQAGAGARGRSSRFTRRAGSAQTWQTGEGINSIFKAV